MPLSHEQAITADLIADIQTLKENKVIVLIGKSGEKVVLKKEDPSATEKQVKTAKAVMKAVDPAVSKIKILTQDEADEISTWVASMLEEAETDEQLKLNNKKATIDGLKDLQAIVVQWKNDLAGGRAPVHKAAFHEVKDLESELKKRLASGAEKDKTGIRLFVSALNRAGGFETLGQIIVADFFNMNTDRFNPTGGIKIKLPKGDTKLAAIVNVGNIFIRKDGAEYKISGLDFIDPFSSAQTFTRRISVIDREVTEGYWLKILADKQQRAALAKNVASDLEKIVNPKKGRFFGMDKLDSKAANRIEKGIVRGAQAIAEMLKKKFPGDKWKDAHEERHALLLTIAE